ncbi:rhomboid family intramembrane serine protease [Rhizohabitans arisaemae]|uniref:rhomboid family intramembrane serine protease n=1 Tax=Rhizohabitans arisaemae TaxID=2720610 RepID=UPI0024B0DACC|nr:rhomboid family intramembrane serine protease [Rhizohabitans arisaemae]
MGLPPNHRSDLATGFVGAVRVAVLVALLVAGLWALEIFDYATGSSLDGFGIRPRSLDGLPGIVLAPFLHFGFDHLIANSLPLLVLGFFAAMRGIGRFLLASVVIMLVSGAGVWLISPSDSVTIGASGMVFGYFGYLVARGVFDRRTVDIALAVVSVVLYGSLIWGVLPSQQGVSWQGHLFGLVGGVLAAWVMRRQAVRPVPGTGSPYLG